MSKRTAEQFEEELIDLVADEMKEARSDDERAAKLIGALTEALGKVVAATCKGDAKATDKLLAGIDHELIDTVTHFAPIFQMFDGLATQARGRRKGQ